MTERQILCIDDSSTTRKLVGYALAQRGYRMLEAADGETGLSLMERHKPELVLLDLVLPDTDGFSLVDPLRTRGRGDTTIIAFSGFITNVEEGRLAAAGFDDVVGKPVDPDRLASLIDARIRGTTNANGKFGAGRKLLIVDDDPLQLKLLRICMDQVGFDVVTARDGAEALEVAKQHRPVAIVADVMMPRCDGFELAFRVRSDEALRELPVLLVTSSYTEQADRDLAKNAGATDLVVRTPSLTHVRTALEEALRAPPPETSPSPSTIEQERLHRVVSQLERQVQLNTGLSQRCSTLSAELAVLTNVSELVIGDRGLEVALDEALAACFDAGGVSLGALYLLSDANRFHARPIVAYRDWTESDRATLFGHDALIRRCLDERRPLHIPSGDVEATIQADLLARSETRSVLLLPLCYGDEPQGVLAMFSQTESLSRPDWLSFTQAIANQIAQVLALGLAFEETRRAEKIAHERTAFLDAVLEHAPDAVVFVDRHGIVRYASHPASDRRAIAKEGDLLALAVDDRAEHLLDRIREVVENDAPQSWEEIYPDHEGEDVSYWVKMGPVRQGDEITGVVIIARDVTEKKALDAKLMVSDRMASVGLLAAGVAHEVNNPMQALVVNLELALAELDRHAKRSAVPSEIAESLVDAREAADRIRTIIRDLRMFSRVEKEKREPVDVPRLLDSTLRLARNEVRQRARVKTSYAEVPAALANEARLGQVFLNLVINASHAIAPGHYEENAIEVGAREVDGRLVVSVSDTGCGIPPEAQSKIFKPFFTTKPSDVGTGLGLSICQRIVRSFDGELTFQSEVGRGTTFYVTLPLAPVETTPLPEPTTAAPATRHGRVLVVDDETIVRRSVDRVLKNRHTVVGASDAAEALEKLESEGPFDLLICDLMMPGVNGAELFDEVKTIDPGLAERTIFLTGGIITPWVRNFLRTVPNHRLEKPFDVQVLRVLVDSLIR